MMFGLALSLTMEPCLTLEAFFLHKFAVGLALRLLRHLKSLGLMVAETPLQSDGCVDQLVEVRVVGSKQSPWSPNVGKLGDSWMAMLI